MEGEVDVEALARDFADEHGVGAVELALQLAPVFAHLRKGSELAVRTMRMYHDAGLPTSLLMSLRPDRKSVGERTEISLVTGSSVQLMLDFDLAAAG